MKTKEMFMEFLDQHDAKDEYLTYLKEPEIFEEEDWDLWLLGAFIWNNSKSGNDFWKTIYTKWNNTKFVENNRISREIYNTKSESKYLIIG